MKTVELNIPKSAEGMQEAWKCSGCGAPSPNRLRSCDCLTNCVSSTTGGSAWKIDPTPFNLANVIRTRLLGVAPDDQDVVLEDHDWQVILRALDLLSGQQS